MTRMPTKRKANGTKPTSERDYKKEAKYHASEKQKKDRAARNAARRKLAKAGKVRKGDGKDVHHKDKNPRNNSSKNLSVTPRSKNRSSSMKKKK